MTIKLIIIYLLNLFDYLATMHQVNKLGTNPHGIVLEANPLMRPLMDEPLLFFTIKIVFVTGFLTIIYSFRDKQIAQIGTWVLLAVYGALALYHIYLFLIPLAH